MSPILLQCLRTSVFLIGLVAFICPITAQFPPRLGPLLNLTTVSSPVDPAVKLSYRQPSPVVCSTAFSRQRQYTGWVSIPAAETASSTAPTNLFFWFVSARQNTSALTIWLNGGPGSSSLFGFFTGNGPCQVYEVGVGVYETMTREWGWDRASNMLFVDQPNQVGFSYDVFTEGTLDLFSGNITSPPQPLPPGRPAGTFLNGTFGSGLPGSTANTTEGAAMAIWHLMQAFLGAFPEYKATRSASVGVNLFGESYGGKYVPVFAELWQIQNNRRAAGLLPPQTVDIRLKSVGIVNGCVDSLIESPFYPIMASNNTYNVKAISSVRADLANATFYTPGGCRDMILECRSAVANPAGVASTSSFTSASSPAAPLSSAPASSFPYFLVSSVRTVPSLVSSSSSVAASSTTLPDMTDSTIADSICSAAYSVCSADMMEPYFEAGLSAYDISHTQPDSFPPSTFLEYVNTAEFQRAIGAGLNFTLDNSLVISSFDATGDIARGPIIPKLARLLTSGVRVGLIYGDRDYICNWLGGEAVSLAIAAAAGPTYGPHFATAGYEPIVVNETYVGGLVRQYGNLSFSRVFQAGHYVASYQPETAFNIFARIALGTSLSSGAAINLTSYASTGPPNAQDPNAVANDATHESAPSAPAPTCWLRNFADTCDSVQQSMIVAGQGVTINGVLYASSADWPLAASSTPHVVASMSSVTLTGFFTATSTPLPDPNPATRPVPLTVHHLFGGATLAVVLALLLLLYTLWLL